MKFPTKSIPIIMSPRAHSQSDLPIHTTEPIRVTYRDTDRMGHAYHSQYLVWFEIGRTELLRSLGSTYRAWEDDHGVYLPVRSITTDYLVPAKYDELLQVRTEMIRITRASVHFSYQLLRCSDQQILATGSTLHPFVDKAGKILRVAHTLLPQFF